MQQKREEKHSYWRQNWPYAAVQAWLEPHYCLAFGASAASRRTRDLAVQNASKQEILGLSFQLTKSRNSREELVQAVCSFLNGLLMGKEDKN
ncbi:MAG: hypothetical protein C0507_16275 [Cyanobacteria bacterium PR.3.49]|nr:hypothetical protein [Cyanobacteria bacterium PR.3.49]